MVQQLHGAFNERLDNLEENHLNALTELVTQRFPIVQQLLTPYAEHELSEILSLRALNHISVRKRIQNLFKRVTEGDLSAIDESTKYKVYQWTARLCATQAETLPLARKIRDELVDDDVPIDLSIVDALIYEADGDIDAALRCLRDAKDADSRSAWFGLLTRVRAEIRHSVFERIIARLGPTFDSDGEMYDSILRGVPDFSTLSIIFDESSNGIASIQENTAEKILRSQPMALVDFVPQSMAYYERFVGPVAIDQDSSAYMNETLAQYRAALFDRDLAKALEICCLGAVHDDLSPGQWLALVEDDVLWSALNSSNFQLSPFSLLGALDVALYRQHDERFRQFALTAVEQLLHENFGFAEEIEVYRLLQIVGDFVLNRINLLEDGATKPGYWKRLAAWMQAGYIVETMLRSSHLLSLDVLERWTHDNMTAAGAYANLVDAKKEPMLFAARMMSNSLRFEVVGRLEVLRLRHGKNGRELPAAEQVDRLIGKLEVDGHRPALQFPGPLEGDRRPTAAVPVNVEEEIKKLADGEDSELLGFLVTVSQLFSLSERQIELAGAAIEQVFEEKGESGAKDLLESLEHASVIAAANRSSSLAAIIGDKIVQISPLVSEGEAEMVPRILLQAAVAHEDELEWFAWLDERLLEMVQQLPSHPSRALSVILGHLEEIEIVLPTQYWFHGRAKSAALSGAV